MRRMLQQKMARTRLSAPPLGALSERQVYVTRTAGRVSTMSTFVHTIRQIAAGIDLLLKAVT